MKKLIERLSMISDDRTEENEQTLLSPVEIVPIIEEVLNLLKLNLTSNIKLETNFKFHDLAVICNPTWLYQIFLNIGINAIDSMKHNYDLLTVELDKLEVLEGNINNYPSGSYVVITIEDTGEGISPEFIDKVFDPFFSTKKTMNKMGLGLTVAQNYVKQMNGFIKLDSFTGSGTKVSIILPCIKSEESYLIKNDSNLVSILKKVPVVDNPAEKDCIVANPEFNPFTKVYNIKDAQNRKPNVLVVDDNKEMFQFYKTVLEHLGCNLLWASNTLDAKHIFQHSPDKIDLALIDYYLPDTTGATLIKYFHSINDKIIYLLITGKYSTSLKTPEVQEIIIKPIQLQTLLHILKHWLYEKGFNWIDDKVI